ncbi:hypothetical protein J6590_079526 [Homalodisca vitripennis]|nr:hypothetical protein J6590_079526 [Homalodisca vitripennis]
MKANNVTADVKLPSEPLPVEISREWITSTISEVTLGEGEANYVPAQVMRTKCRV